MDGLMDGWMDTLRSQPYLDGMGVGMRGRLCALEIILPSAEPETARSVGQCFTHSANGGYLVKVPKS